MRTGEELTGPFRILGRNVLKHREADGSSQSGQRPLPGKTKVSFMKLGQHQLLAHAGRKANNATGEYHDQERQSLCVKALYSWAGSAALRRLPVIFMYHIS